MKKISFLFTLLLITCYSCSSDDNNSNATSNQTNTCEKPDNLDVDFIETTSATLYWGGAARDFFEVEYGLNGYTFSNGTKINSNENRILITGLLSNTAYDFYVRGNCGGNDFSDWVGPYSFVTN